MSEDWEVILEVDGRIETVVVTIDPPFGIPCADAEVKALKAVSGRKARALRSRFIREVRP